MTEAVAGLLLLLTVATGIVFVANRQKSPRYGSIAFIGTACVRHRSAAHGADRRPRISLLRLPGLSRSTA